MKTCKNAVTDACFERLSHSRISLTRIFSLSFIFGGMVLGAGENAKPQSESVPLPQTSSSACGSRAVQLGIRHLEGSGVGYSQGYTTLEGFFLG